jgi:hypothetical protein
MDISGAPASRSVLTEMALLSYPFGGRLNAAWLRALGHSRLGPWATIKMLPAIVAIFLAGECAGVEISRLSGCSGDVLRLRGLIERGDYLRLKSHFGERKIVGLDLGSEGGSLEDGFLIARFAQRKRLTVYVSGECDSACAFIFLTSRKRYIARGAKIGVHAVGNVHGTEDIATIRDTVQLARLSARLGVPSSVIGRMVTTPPGKMSYLDGRDLRTLKTIVRDPFAGMGETANTNSKPKGCGANAEKEVSRLE